MGNIYRKILERVETNDYNVRLSKNVYGNGFSEEYIYNALEILECVCYNHSDNTTSIAYNDDGIRTSKTVNGVKHTYKLNGSQIVSEQWEDKLLVYLYDVSGSPIGMMYRTTSYAVGTFDVFWYEKNLQGDIVAVYNETGTKVAAYTYIDAWGNHSVSYTNGGNSTGAIYNPFRYRGYYYDADLGMYYLQSRYYDSKICRFINADGYASTGQGLTGNNMFAYCGNNPVNRVDPTGEIWFLIAVGAAIAIVTIVCEQAAYKNAEKTYEEYDDVIVVENGKVSNANQASYKDIWALSAYVRYYTDSGAQGTSYGLAIEWAAHKVGDSLGMSGGKDLDFGKTIVSDFEDHHSVTNIWQPIIMNGVELITNPLFYIYDIWRAF